MNNNSIPLLSVFMITYNHENFIRKSLESVMMQQANFPFEVIIGEDCSTDNTRAVIKEFENKYPNIIKPIYHNTNVGPYKNAYEFCFPQLKGKYVACLEGDDYWTDPLKLQKQVDFLEVNPDYAICAHHISILENDILQDCPNLRLANNGSFTIEDLAKENLLHTPSVVYRNGLIKTLPSWFEMSPVGDYVLHMLNAKGGKIKYLPETMAVYRKHAGGAWSAQPMINTLEKWILVLSLLLTENFDERVIELLKIHKRETAVHYLKLLLDHDTSLFKIKLKELTADDPELDNDWLLNLFIADHSELNEIRGKYYGLKNSRLRKYLSYVFKQLKI